MARSTVIVALPSEGEVVNKYSSEKVPHLTLLYLGEVSDALISHINEYVAHAASVSLSPFYLPVDYRGELGDDKADVLFFETKSWWLSKVGEFRANLLKNSAIETAYDSADKFGDRASSQWIPHLTMGYPATPAKKPDLDHDPFYGVHFDRIAVWTGDYEGLEFRLEEKDDMVEAFHSEMGEAYASCLFGKMSWDEFFAHYGVKGMKWGVRNDKGHEGEQVKTKKLDKLDKKWEKQHTGFKGSIKAHNKAVPKINADLDKLNDSPEVKKAADDGTLLDYNHPTTVKYHADVDRIYNKRIAEAYVGMGLNPSGTKQYEYREDADGNPYAYLAPVKKGKVVKHAADSDEPPVLEVVHNAKGLVTGFEPAEMEHSFILPDEPGVDEVLAHCNSTGMAWDDYLAHYGVKGMRWGVITNKDGSKTITHPAKNDPAAKPSKSDVQIKGKPGKYAKTKGGKQLPIHDDALAALDARQRAKGSTTDALSNAELKKLNERLQLERQFQELNFASDRRSKGARFVDGLFGNKRYGGPKRVFKDPHEELGADAKAALDEYRKMRRETAEPVS